jgi:hypothetical protein
MSAGDLILVERGIMAGKATAQRSGAIERLERGPAGWILLARAHLLVFARHNERFATETVRAYAEKRGLPPPPDPRAWGSVAVKCRRDCIIKADGYAPSTKKCAHSRPTMQWRSMVYRP